MSHNPGRFLLPLSAFAATTRDTLSRLPLRGWLSADSLISLGTLAGGFLSVRLCMDSADAMRVVSAHLPAGIHPLLFWVRVSLALLPALILFGVAGLCCCGGARWYWQAGRRSRSCSAPLCCSFCGSRCRCGAGQRQAIFPILPSSIRPACVVCPRSCNDIWQGCWHQRRQVPLSADCIQHWSFSDRNSESIKPKNKKEVHSHEFHKKR